MHRSLFGRTRARLFGFLRRVRYQPLNESGKVIRWMLGDFSTMNQSQLTIKIPILSYEKFYWQMYYRLLIQFAILTEIMRKSIFINKSNFQDGGSTAKRFIHLFFDEPLVIIRFPRTLIDSTTKPALPTVPWQRRMWNMGEILWALIAGSPSEVVMLQPVQIVLQRNALKREWVSAWTKTI